MPLAVKLNKKYTYEDYLNLPEHERWEIIEGVPYDMSPGPGTAHQSISHIINGIFFNHLKKRKCKAFAAPFDVRFVTEKENEKGATVVQPDLVVICDRKKLTERGCTGAPDIAVEILSEHTAYKDETEKLSLYEKHGVKEYWIVNPRSKYVMVYRHNGEIFDKPEYLREEDILTSRVLEGLTISLRELFGDADIV